MKTIKIVIAAMLFFTTTVITAQVTVNFGTRPVWAPAAPAKVQYYYLPDIETYYDVPSKQYIYLKNGNWVKTTSLPARYRGYDLYKGKTVYLTDYKGKSPYKYYNQHKVKYVGNRKWKINGHDNGNHYGKFKGKHGNGNNGNENHDNENHENENHGKENHGKENGHGKGHKK